MGSTVENLTVRIQQVNAQTDLAYGDIEAASEIVHNMHARVETRAAAAQELDEAGKRYQMWVKLQISLTKSYDEAVKLDKSSETKDERPKTALEKLRNKVGTDD